MSARRDVLLRCWSVALRFNFEVSGGTSSLPDPRGFPREYPAPLGTQPGYLLGYVLAAAYFKVMRDGPVRDPAALPSFTANHHRADTQLSVWREDFAWKFEDTAVAYGFERACEYLMCCALKCDKPLRGLWAKLDAIDLQSDALHQLAMDAVQGIDCLGLFDDPLGEVQS